MINQELELGNYVRFKGYEPIFCIFSMAMDSVLLYNKSCSAEEMPQANIGELNPIPLTIEMVESLGFVKENDRLWQGQDNCWHYQYEPTWMITPREDNGDLIWSIIDTKSECYRYIECKFVHQLQNMFDDDYGKHLSLDFFVEALDKH